ncbi:MAG TPA: hypothetical protein VHV51_11230 [Polyangiaceae bacterium]|nr:hypothetical protein [Polyangiaceae bacterium]
MRAAFAAFRLRTALASAGLLASGCAPPLQGPLAGASDVLSKPPDPAPAPLPVATVWSEYATVRAWPPLNDAPFRSRGHQPEQEVDLRASSESRDTYRALVSDSAFPDGAELVELSHSGSGPGYVMRKSGGNWSYLALDARGAVIASGALSLCAGCHAEAPADCVFGLPRPDSAVAKR